MLLVINEILTERTISSFWMNLKDFCFNVQAIKACGLFTMLMLSLAGKINFRLNTSIT